jgi:hypothetical protein
MTTSVKTIKSLFIRNLIVCRGADRLIEIGEQAQADGDAEQLRFAGGALLKMSGGGANSDASMYYSALALNRSQASRAQAEAMLISLASTGSALYRAKALLALGTNQIMHQSDPHSAAEYYKNAEAVNSGHPLVLFMIRSQRAVMASLAGAHRHALADFKRLLPMAQSIGARLPFYEVNYINSLAEAHCRVGNLSEAAELAELACSSPLARPEFQETRDDIAAMRERINRKARLSEADRKGAYRRELHALVIKPDPDKWTADGLGNLVAHVRQVKP